MSSGLRSEVQLLALWFELLSTLWSELLLTVAVADMRVAVRHVVAHALQLTLICQIRKLPLRNVLLTRHSELLAPPLIDIEAILLWCLPPGLSLIEVVLIACVLVYEDCGNSLTGIRLPDRLVSITAVLVIDSANIGIQSAVLRSHNLRLNICALTFLLHAIDERDELLLRIGIALQLLQVFLKSLNRET